MNASSDSIVNGYRVYIQYSVFVVLRDSCFEKKLFVDAQAHSQLFGMEATVENSVESPAQNGAATAYKTA